MRTVDEWKATLRGALKEAMRRREADAVAALRETLSAIDNAEAVAPPALEGGSEVIAGAAAGLGAGEARRRALSAEDVMGIIARELEERRVAAATYEKLGRAEEASRLRAQVQLLEAL